jgi:hypothetical protein
VARAAPNRWFQKANKGRSGCGGGLPISTGDGIPAIHEEGEVGRLNNETTKMVKKIEGKNLLQ